MWGGDVVRLTTRTGELDLSRRSDAPAEWWGLVVAVVVTVLIGWSLPYEPDRVTATVNNPTDHRLYINASTPHDASLSFVTVVEPLSTKSMPDVVDRGPRWVLHLRTPGASAGNIEVSRADLVKGSVVIPLSINDQLAASGVPSDVEVPVSDP